MTQNRAYTLLPEYLKTIYNRRSTKILEDIAFEPENFSRVEGQIGSKIGVTQSEIDREPFIPERNLEREAYQLSVAVTGNGNMSFYTDLIGQLRGEDVDVSDHSKLFDADWYSWTPPIDIDMWTNFHRYVWTGAGEARYQGEYITREAQGNRTVLYEVVNGGGVARDVALSSVAKASFTDGNEIGDLKEDCTDSKRRIYRWSGSAWEPVFFTSTDCVPTDWSLYSNGDYVYPCCFGHDMQRIVLYEYREEAGRWVTRIPVISFEAPIQPWTGMLWEDARDEPKRTIRKWDGTQWSEISWSAVTTMDDIGVAANGSYRILAKAVDDISDGWAKNNWWRNRDDLSDRDKARYAEQQAVRPILSHWAGMELFSGSSRTARHDMPRYKLWAYKESADDILEIDSSNFEGNNLASGSTVIQYSVATAGSDDSFIGFPLVLNSTAEITFEATIESDSLSYDDGTILGYKFFKDIHTGKLKSLWAKADAPIKPSKVDGFYEQPMALTNNPDHETLTTFTRSEALRHFESIIEEQSDGEPLGSNGFRWSVQDATKGATLIDPEHSLLRTMALLLDDDLDLPEAIRAMAIEYERFSSRLKYSIDRVWSEGEHTEIDGLNYKSGKTATTFADAALTYVLSGYDESRPFWHSDMGTYVDSNTSVTKPISVPCSAARTGAIPAYVPRKFSDLDGDWLLNHDGSVSPAWGDLRDDVWLNVQTRFFNEVPSVRRTETDEKSARLDDVGFWIDRYANNWKPEVTLSGIEEVVADHTALSPSAGDKVFSRVASAVAYYTGTEWQLIPVSYGDVFKEETTDDYWAFNGFELVQINLYDRSGSFDYTYNEAQNLLRREFETWASLNGFDPYAAIQSATYDDPFSWNMIAAGAGGGWRSIYKRVYGTDRPHIAPWECWGFTVEPDWWRTTYVPTSTATDGSPRYGSAHAMWADLKVANSAPVDIEAFMLLPSNAPVPVDASGELIDPLEAGIISEGDVPEGRIDDRWDYGGLGPVELEFTRSVRYTFSKALAAYLLKPNRFVEKLWTDYIAPIGKDKIWRGAVQVDIKTWKRSKIADVSVHGEDGSTIDVTVDADVSVGNPGINAWISETIKLKGGNPSTKFGEVVRSATPVVSWRCSGFINKNRTTITLPNGIEVPYEDVHTILHRSKPIASYFHSGIAIVKSGTGYRIYGYDSGNSKFTIETSSQVLQTGLTERSQTYTATATQTDFILTNYEVGDADKGRFAVTINGIRVSSSEITFTSSTSFVLPVGKVKSGDVVKAFLRSATADYRSHLRYFTAGGRNWNFNPVGSGETTTIDYGHWFATPEEVLQFCIDHGRYMESVGWSWEDPDDPSAGVDDWESVAKRFAEWASEGPTEGSIFIDCPSSTALTITLPHGDVGSIETLIKGTYGVLDAGGSAISPEDIEVTKDGSRATVRPMDGETDIFGLRVLASEIEHVLYVSNTTRFNDIVYSPVTGLRHTRMSLKSYRSNEWGGRFEAPGFFINDSDLIPNFDKLAKDFTRYYDSVDPIDDPLKFDQAWWLYGYRPRSYMDGLGASPQTQLDYHRGLIANKGTIEPIKAYAKGTTGGSVDVDEIWAWHAALYGETKDRMRFRFFLDESEVKDRIVITKFTDEDLPEDSDVEILPPSLDSSRWVDPVPDSKNPVIPMIDYTPVSDLIYKMKLVSRDETYQKLFHWDPEVGLHEPLAYSHVDIETDIDPAVYTDGPNALLERVDNWGERQVGTIWWDTSKRSYSSYRTKSTNREKAVDWGQLEHIKVVSTAIEDSYYRLTTDGSHGLSEEDSLQIGTKDGSLLVGFVVTVVDSSTVDVNIYDPEEPETSIIDVASVVVDFITTNKIEVYEWIESSVPPDEYSLENGAFSILNPSDPDYVTVQKRPTSPAKYYFWAAFRKTPIVGKELSVSEVRSRLENPAASNVGWFAPASSDVLLIRPYSLGTEDVYEVDVEIQPDSTRIHDEWVLLVEGKNQPHTEIVDKLVDCLLEEDGLGNALPREAFLGSDRYGTGFGKTVFESPVLARRRFLGAVNQTLSSYRALDDSSWSLSFPVLEEGTWWKVADWEDINWVGVISSEEVQDQTELSEIPRPTNGDLIKVVEAYAHPVSSGVNVSATYSRDNNTWIERRGQSATIEIDESIFEGDSARSRIKSLMNFLPYEKQNTIIVELFGEILRQHRYCWWIFKTSLVDLRNTISVGQPATKPSDEVPHLVEAFNESKAYRDKIRSTRTTAEFADVDNAYGSVSEVRDTKLSLFIDRLTHTSIEEGGWDSRPWDTSSWDLPQWVPEDAEDWWITAAEFSSVTNVKTYEIIDVPSYVDLKVVKSDGTAAPTNNILRSGAKVIVSFTASPPSGTYYLQGALSKYEGRQPVDFDETFSSFKRDVEHAAARAGYPRVIGFGDDEELQARKFFGGDEVVDDVLGGDMEERLVIPSKSSLLINVDEHWTAVRAGWDTIPWDLGPWDLAPQESGTVSFTIKGQEGSFNPSETRDAINSTELFETDSNTESAKALKASDNRMRISSVKIDWGSTGTFEDYEGTISHPTMSSVSFTRPDGIWLEYDGNSLTQASAYRIKDVYLNEVQLTSGVDYTLSNSNKTVSINADLDVGNIFIESEIPTDAGNIVRLVYDRFYFDSNELKLLGGRVEPEWNSNYIGISNHSVQKALKLTDSDKMSFEFRDGIDSDVFSIEMTVILNSAGTTGSSRVLLSKGNTTTDRHFRIALKGGSTSTPRFSWTNDSNTISNLDWTSQLVVGEPKTIGISSDGNEIRLYADGKLENVMDISSVGISPSSFDRPIELRTTAGAIATVSDLRIWKKKLSAKEFGLNERARITRDDYLVLNAYLDNSLKDQSGSFDGEISTGSATYVDVEDMIYDLVYLYPNGTPNKWNRRTDYKQALQLALIVEDVSDLSGATWDVNDGTLILSLDDNTVYERDGSSWVAKFETPWEEFDYVDNATGKTYRWVKSTGLASNSGWVLSSTICQKHGEALTDINFSLEEDRWEFTNGSGSVVTDPNSGFESGQSKVMEIASNGTPIIADCKDRIKTRRDTDINAFVKVHIEGSSALTTPIEISLVFFDKDGDEIVSSLATEELTKTGDLYWPVRVSAKPPIEAVEAGLRIVGSDEETIRFVAVSLSYGIEPYKTKADLFTHYGTPAGASVFGIDSEFASTTSLISIVPSPVDLWFRAAFVKNEDVGLNLADNSTVILTTGLTRNTASNWWDYSFEQDSSDYISCGTDPENVWDSGGYLSAVLPAPSGSLSDGAIVVKNDNGGWGITRSSGDIIFDVEFSTTDGTWSAEIPAEIDETKPIILEVEYDSSATTNDPVIRINGFTASLTETSTPVGTRTEDSTSTLQVGGDDSGTAGYLVSEIAIGNGSRINRNQYFYDLAVHIESTNSGFVFE
jgi:hypothetical protein